MVDDVVIIYTLLHPTDPSFHKNFDDFVSRTLMLEFAGADGIAHVPRPCTINTHIPFNRVPKHPTAKYICLIRNPKDVCVSHYHHAKKLNIYGIPDMSFDDYFEIFIKGKQDYGIYFNWILQIWEHKDDENVLLLSYESMKKDVLSAIHQMARLLNIPLTKDILERTVTFSSSEYMKEAYDSKQKEAGITMSTEEPDFRDTRLWIRKGCVGDWKTILSDEQRRRIDEQFAAATLNHSDLRHFLDENLVHCSESEQ